MGSFNGNGRDRNPNRQPRGKSSRRRQRPNLESLEARTLLAGDPTQAAIVVGLSSPVGSGGSYDLGEHYIVGGQERDLHRATDQFVIRVEQGVGPELFTRLTGRGGAANGFVPSATSNDQLWVLTRAEPFSGTPQQRHQQLQQVINRVAADANVEWATQTFVDPAGNNNRLIVTNEVVVALKPGANPAQVLGDTSKFAGYRNVRGTPDQFVVTVKAAPGAPTLAAANALNADGRVAWSSPDFYMVHRPTQTNDPLFPDQWYLQNTGQAGGTVGADAKVVGAWNEGAIGTGVLIAVLDDGFQLSHPDLAPNIFTNTGEIPGNGIDDDGNGYVDDANGWDFWDNDADPNPVNAADNHGTAVAGIAAARGNNSLGIAGAAYDSRILPVRIPFVAAPVTTFAEAVYYASGRTADGLGTWGGAAVLNHSYGSGTPNDVIQAAFDWSATSGRGGLGAVNFAATGNDGETVQGTISYPAAYSNVIAVGASTRVDVRSPFSQFSNELDLVAPGTDLPTTDRTGAAGYVDGDFMPTFTGTSAASPLAAGVGALVLNADPTLTFTGVRQLLRDTADKIGGVQYDANGFHIEYGYGRIDAAEAVRQVAGLRVSQVSFDGGATTVPSGGQIGTLPTSVTLQMNKPVDPASVDASDLVFSLVPAGVSVVVGQPTVAAGGTQITFPLTISAQAGSTVNGPYAFAIQAGSFQPETGQQGNDLFSYSFQISDTVAPRVTSTILLGRTIVVQFNEAMRADTMNLGNIQFFRHTAAGFESITADPRARGFFDSVNNRYIIDLTDVPQSLMPSGNYALVVKDVVTDLVGNRLDGEFLGAPPTGTNSQFPSGNGSPGGEFRQYLANVTLTAPVINRVGLDQSSGISVDGAPRVIGTLFSRNAVEILFSEPMDASTINKGSIKLYRSTPTGLVSVSDLAGATVRYDAIGRKAVIDLSGVPDAQVPVGATYQIVAYSLPDWLPSALDLSGNPLDGEFSTLADPLTRNTLFPSGNGSIGGHFVQILPPLDTSGAEVFTRFDSGIAGDENTNVTRPRFTGRITNGFPGARGGVQIAIQFSALHIGEPELNVGQGGRGYVGTPDLIVTTDRDGNFSFQAPVDLPDGFHLVRVVAIGDTEIPPQAGLSARREISFRIDTTNPVVATTVVNGTQLSQLTSLTIGVLDQVLPSSGPLSVPTQLSLTALDPISATNISNYSLIQLGADGQLGGTGANADRDFSSYIIGAEFTPGGARQNAGDPYTGQIELSFAPGLPEGSYAIIARRPQPGYSGITDAAGNPIDGDVSRPGAQDLVVRVIVQPTAAYITGVKAVSPVPNGPDINPLNPSTYVLNDPRSFFELVQPGNTPRADAPPQEFWIDFSTSLQSRDYTNFVRLIRTADMGGALADGDFGVDPRFLNGEGYTEVGGLIITLENSVANAQPGQPGYRNRLRVQLPDGFTLPADTYRFYLPNAQVGGQDLRVFDSFGNHIDGEFLGNETALGTWETLLPNGLNRPGLSGDGVAGGAFQTGYMVVPNGNVIYVRPDYVDDPFLTSDDPDGSLAKPYASLAPEAQANALNGGDLNSAANFGANFDARFDRNGNGRFDRSALFAAEQRVTLNGGPAVIVALAGARTDTGGGISQTSYVLQAPSGTDPVVNNASISVPANTMLMIDAGATIKSFNAAILVQNQGSSIQVRGGQGSEQVTFTSFLDDSIAGDTNNDGGRFAPNGGDWGGILLRSFNQSGRNSVFPVDGRLKAPVGGDALSGADDALSIINFADIRFGGGSVPRNAAANNAEILFRYDAITMLNSRPAVTNTRIRDTGGVASQAAISGNVDSFREDDLTRGPLLRELTFENNSINGIFVRPEAGQPFARPSDAVGYLNNPVGLGGARNYTFDDPYPYVLTAPIHLGTRMLQDTGGNFVSTTDRLYIQPGMMLKAGTGSGIEVRNSGASINIGDRTYISGFDQNPNYSPLVNGFRPNTEGDAKVVLTSFFDDAAETYFEDPNTGERRVIVAPIDTDNGGSFLQPTPGNIDRRARWGGISVLAGARAVIDETVFQYGGGTMAITTGTDPIRPVLSFGITEEIGAPGIGGLGTRASVTNNDFLDNFEAPMGITPNGLLAGNPLTPLSSGNPFFRGNVMQRNTYNGLRIYTLPTVNRFELNPRGISEAIPGDDNVNLSVDSVLDDTDLVYIQRGSYQLAGGFTPRLPDPVNFLPEREPNVTLTIQSSLPDTLLANGQRIARPGESVVVKLLNFNAAPGDGENGLDPGNAAHMGAGWVVGADDGQDPDGDPLIDSGAGSQIRIVGIGADATTGQERVPVIITSLHDDTAGKTVRGVDMFNTYPNPDPTFDPFAVNPDGSARTTPQAGDGGVLLFGGNSLWDYNLFDPRGGNIIDNADIRFMTRIELQGGGIIDVADANGDETFDLLDSVRSQKVGASIVPGAPALFQNNMTNAMTIANSNLANFSQVGVISHPGFDMIGRDVGFLAGLPAANDESPWRTGFRGQPVELFMVNNTISNMPVGVRVNSETGVGPFPDGDTQQEQMTLVLLNNTLYNNQTGLRTQAVVGQGGDSTNAFSSVRWLAMNNIFSNHTVEAITAENQQQGSQGQNNLFFGNASNFGFLGTEGTVLIPDGTFGGLNDSVFGDPRFRNAAAGDFRLLPDSAAIDASQDVLGPVDWGDMLNPISDANGIRTQGNRQGAGAVSLAFAFLGINPVQGDDVVALPGSPRHTFLDQWVAALPGTSQASGGTGSNAATWHYRPIFGERDQSGLLRQDSPRPDVGQGSDPWFDIGAHEYVPVNPPQVISVSNQYDVVAVLPDPTNPTTGTRLVDIYNPGALSGFNVSPVELQFRFDTLINPRTLNNRTVLLAGAGRDRQLGTPDDVRIDLSGKLRYNSTTSILTIDMAGINLLSDQYLITLVGSGAEVIRDTQGVALDGENTANGTPTGALQALPSGDEFPGGNFYVAFAFDTSPPVIAPGSLALAPSSDAGRRDNITNDPTPSFSGVVNDVFPPLNPGVGQTVILDLAGPDGAFGTADDILNAGSAVSTAGGAFTVTYGVDGAGVGLNPNLPATIPNSPYNVGPDGYLGPNPITGAIDDTGYSVARVRVIDQAGNPSNPNDPNARVSFVIDTVGPRVTSTNPISNGTVLPVGGRVNVAITLNENIDPASLNGSSVQARRAGGDGVFGTADDVLLTVQIPTNPLSNLFTSQGAQRLSLSILGATANDVYRLTLRGTGPSVVTDIATNAIDGNADGAPGGDFHLDFVVFDPDNSRIIYVSAGANDNGADGSRFAPVSTLMGYTLPGPDGVPGNDDDITVPGAFDLANAGDTIAVLPGVYREAVELESLVRVVSAATTSTDTTVIPGNALQTIIAPLVAASGQTVAVRGDGLISQPDFSTELSGFTIVLPLQGPSGGTQTIDPNSVGIRLSNSDALISRNYVINANQGIVVLTSGANAGTPRIASNAVVGNITGITVMDSGASSYRNSQPTKITNNTIAYNSTGLVILDTDRAVGPERLLDIENNIFAQNFASSGSSRSGMAIFAATDFAALAQGNLFSNNGASQSNDYDDVLGLVPGINPFVLGTEPDLAGNFVGAPDFTNPRDPRPLPQGQGQNVFFTDASFDLRSTSAAIDSAINALAPTHDFLFRTRVDIADRGLPGRGPADIGAFEFMGRAGGPIMSDGPTNVVRPFGSASQLAAETSNEAPSNDNNSAPTVRLAASNVAAPTVLETSQPMTIQERFAAFRARRQASWFNLVANRRGL